MGHRRAVFVAVAVRHDRSLNEVVWVEVEREALEECAVVVCPGPTEEVATISNFRGFTADLYMKNEQPADLDPSAPDACKIVFDQTVVFGAELKDFRSVVYGGKTADYVKSVNQITQSVGVYPADAAAQIYFDRLIPDMVKCSQAHEKNYDFTLTRPDPSTIFLDAEYWKAAYRVKSTVMATTSTVGFHHPNSIVLDVLDAITDRID